jgi:hypothetical protein
MSDKENTAKFLADPDEAQKTIDQMSQSNIARIQNLADQGIPLGPEVLALLKVEALVETVLPNPESKLVYQYNLETRKRAFIEDLLKEIRQMQLTQGVAAAKSKLITPGK